MVYAQHAGYHVHCSKRHDMWCQCVPLQGALARCVADGECLENLVCLQLCNGKPDESACQVRHPGRPWRDALPAACNLLPPSGVVASASGGNTNCKLFMF